MRFIKFLFIVSFMLSMQGIAQGHLILGDKIRENKSIRDFEMATFKKERIFQKKEFYAKMSRTGVIEEYLKTLSYIDSLGRIYKQVHYHDDSISGTSVYEFDEQGREYKMVAYDKYGNEEMTKILVYDKNDNIIEEWISKDTKLVEKFIWTYDQNNNPTRRITYNQFNVQVKDDDFTIPTAMPLGPFTEFRKFNDLQQVITVEFYGVEGLLEAVDYYTYYPNGLMESLRSEVPNGKYWNQYLFKYERREN